MISMRARFQTYRAFANATMGKVLTGEELKEALVLQVNNLQTSLLINLGNGKFELQPLPTQVQLSAINGMVVDDFDGDGNLDIVMNTNDFGTEVSIGRYDALNGLFLKGNGKGGFTAESIAQSGIYIPGNGKALVKTRGMGNQSFLIASQNRGPLKAFATNNCMKIIQADPMDAYATITYKNGKLQKQELYYGASFLSQSGRFLQLTDSVISVEITDFKGRKRFMDVK
jgi:hypothetical protein